MPLSFLFGNIVDHCDRKRGNEKMKPIIGVLPLWDDEKESLWMLPGYFHGIEEAGGMPIMLPLSSEPVTIEQCVKMCDGFLFTGGHDVSPEWYGMEAFSSNVICSKMRDEMEGALMKRALEENKSILGICRGIQFLNVHLGGTLYQDLPTEHPSGVEHHQTAPYDIPVHTNRIVKDSPLHQLLEKENLAVNSYHHQAIRKLAPDLEVMAESEDGLVEAVYMPSKMFVWALQWHPEFAYKTDKDRRKIFQAFVDSMN